MTPEMTREEAMAFFAELYYGEHHVPNNLKKFGPGWRISHLGELATFDYDELTRLVFLAHDRCVRVGISRSGPNHVQIAIWKRTGREGRFDERHPTIEQALASWRERHPISEVQP